MSVVSQFSSPTVTFNVVVVNEQHLLNVTSSKFLQTRYFG